ncbi:hypothetical protein EJF18_20563 [Clavispora lusitaniae]|uniref:Uncharacterized protein n=1 Tax=Clavispora lusitaniae TaxID=36911 RepID=A0ACD0WH03_CLALS|nr:hypothetical protein EJF14_20563 [Clavispora lusitaniae]QFZ32319.1 hypothetical protein EJF16_20563 [Clavispora lusitaniae]QFZ37988.1 hypothetical protein EJF15_20563 [Clavispora lusitaniae]QFZ43671.1 hypothetical protein EJF18_20563 [Clavispora lusitaniae]QFZ49348.1 hypothetical protein EJF17_20563 [Clavispora lusitaniae]
MTLLNSIFVFYLWRLFYVFLFDSIKSFSGFMITIQTGNIRTECISFQYTAYTSLETHIKTIFSSILVAKKTSMINVVEITLFLYKSGKGRGIQIAGIILFIRCACGILSITTLVKINATGHQGDFLYQTISPYV